MEYNTTVIDFALRANRKVFLESHFKFISGHNGFRPGKCHLLMADTGAGKSTLARSMIYDILLSLPKDKKLLLILSEESEMDYLIEIRKSGFDLKYLAKLEIITELEYKKNAIAVKTHLGKYFTENEDIGFILFDNITSSCMYSGQQYHTQCLTAHWLKDIAAKINAPILVIVHTNNTKKANKRLIDMNEIRDSKIISIISEFFYILNSISVNDEVFKIIEVCKHRTQSISHKLFLLHFDKKRSMYTKDTPLDYERVKLIFKDKNVY